jgi:hypothetical protein
VQWRDAWCINCASRRLLRACRKSESWSMPKPKVWTFIGAFADSWWPEVPALPANSRAMAALTVAGS